MVFTAAFSAGIVHHLLTGRHAGLVGRRVVPRSGHVVIAGMGQVGLRLAQELRALGVAVVGIDSDRGSMGVALARQSSIPVIIGDATSRQVLARAGLRRALSMVCAASQDRDSIAIAVSSRAVSPRTKIVVRAGADDAIQQTRSLWHIGPVVDVNGLTAAYVVQSILGDAPLVVAPQDDAIVCVNGSEATPSSRVQAITTRRCDCLGPRRVGSHQRLSEAMSIGVHHHEPATAHWPRSMAQATARHSPEGGRSDVGDRIPAVRRYRRLIAMRLAVSAST